MQDAVVKAIVELNVGRLPAVAVAFQQLLEGSWAHPAALARLKRLTPSSSPTDICAALLKTFDDIHSAFPTAAFWWKDEESTFIGACPRITAASGQPSPTGLLGITEGDGRLAWSRQSNLYRRDDRKVFESGRAALDILERQDRGSGTFWLRTSKVPYSSQNGDVVLGGTVGGLDVVTEAEAQTLAARHRR